MKDAEDSAIVRQVVIVVAAMILCLLCGGICGIFVVRDETGGGVGVHRTQLSPVTRPSG